MSMDKDTSHVLEATAVFDPTASAILKTRAADFVDEDYPAFDYLIGEAIVKFIAQYKGGNGFMNSVKRQVSLGKPLSMKQKRAAANIASRALRGADLSQSTGFAPPKSQPAATALTPPPLLPPNILGQVISPVDADKLRNDHGIASTKCYSCGNLIVGEYSWFMANHKRQCEQQKRAERGGQPWTENGSKNTRNIERTKPQHHVDISSLPERGRYAVKQDDGTARFFITTKLKRRSSLRGRYGWSKYPSSTVAYFDAGSVLVREVSGDTKQFIGVQLPSDACYHGEHEEQIVKIMENPNAALVLYGQLIGSCGYCGRTLTDEDSRKVGIGPDCLQNKHIPRLEAQGRAAASAGHHAP